MVPISKHGRLQKLVGNPFRSLFEPGVVLYSVSVIPFQHRSYSVCMSFVRLGDHNG